MRIVRSMWEQPPAQWYPAISAPVLLVPALPADPGAATRKRAQVSAAADALRDATIREYAGADHDIHAQHPHELATDLLTFAARLDS
jgi:alpha-beta hydrolase superfamily lysophospholipase